LKYHDKIRKITINELMWFKNFEFF
jgi:hypothetical protein